MSYLLFGVSFSPAVLALHHTAARDIGTAHSMSCTSLTLPAGRAEA